MTNEESQRMMEFLLEQQAQFTASIERAEEQRIRDTSRLTKLEDWFQAIAELAQITEGRLDKLEESRVQDNERSTRPEDSFVLLTHLAQTTDALLERLEQSGG